MAPLDVGRSRQTGIYIPGVGGRRPAVPVAPAALEAAARARLPARAWAYLAGGAGREQTMEANAAAFARRRIVPRVLRDVEKRDLSVSLLDLKLPAPLLLAPIGVLELAHRQADLAAARAAASLGVPFIFSNQASISMEECAREMEKTAPGAPRWFQLYGSRSDRLTASLVQRAEACGCSAIVLTLDTTMLGWRPRDLDLGFLPFLQGRGLAQYTTDPVFRAELRTAVDGDDGSAPRPPLNLRSVAAALQQKARYPGGLGRNLLSREPRTAVGRFLAVYSRPSLGWKDLDLLHKATGLPVYLKGILHAEDARLAVERGAAGIIVSNHGGRQIDGEVASLDALPAVAAAAAGRVPVLLDSGVRGGADVFKALALGASAACLGRPYVYGLALAGERGVREVVSNVMAELDLTLGLSGCTCAGDVRPGMLAE
ncbi:MAG TPA: alpha-hydroxy-acid oxidizing protein [bacterium]|nr:alpha-hydroxy-acid oxidizing protein [bacterium]